MISPAALPVTAETHWRGFERERIDLLIELERLQIIVGSYEAGAIVRPEVGGWLNVLARRYDKLEAQAFSARRSESEMQNMANRVCEGWTRKE